jgi:CMP/dCMP kinase
MNKPLIIAIDGPSGAGKSTIGKRLARILNLTYIDTGAMYRAVALAVKEAGIDPHDSKLVVEIAHDVKIKLEGDPDSLRIILNERDVSALIRTEQVGNIASIISTIPEVRRELVKRQRELGRDGGVVLDGRDVGTVIFPNATFKFFLTAETEARARRRFEEDRSKLKDLTFEETFKDITTRDERDMSRADSPLTIAEDAIVIDSTKLSIDETLSFMLSTIEGQHLNNRSVTG